MYTSNRVDSYKHIPLKFSGIRNDAFKPTPPRVELITTISIEHALYLLAFAFVGWERLSSRVDVDDEDDDVITTQPTSSAPPSDHQPKTRKKKKKGSKLVTLSKEKPAAA